MDDDYCDQCGGKCDGVHNNQKYVEQDEICFLTKTIMSRGTEFATKVLNDLQKLLNKKD